MNDCLKGCCDFAPAAPRPGALGTPQLHPPRQNRARWGPCDSRTKC